MEKRVKMLVAVLALLTALLLFGGVQVMAQDEPADLSEASLAGMQAAQAAPEPFEFPAEDAPQPAPRPAPDVVQPAPAEETVGESDEAAPAQELDALIDGADDPAQQPAPEAQADPNLQPLAGPGESGDVVKVERQAEPDGEAQPAADWQAHEAPAAEDQPEADAQAGGSWRWTSAGWTYVGADGALLTGWVNDGGAWYYLDPATGLMRTGWLTEGAATFFLNASGQMTTNWMFDGSWYFFSPESGWMHTGWLADSSWWYYFQPGNGRMLTGWMEEGANTYYFVPSGQMATGWLTTGGNWYYFYPESGWMAKGWLSLGNWYYMAPENGVMQTGWQTVNGADYYFTDSGLMATGWLQLGEYFYHFDENTGILVEVRSNRLGQMVVTVYNLNSKSYVTATWDEIIAGIVANEVKGALDMEVYKAQAIAATSWLLYSYNNYTSVPQVGLSTDVAYVMDMINAAVQAVSGQYLAYDGRVILAMYGASSGGVTNSGAAYFGVNYLPYLATVADPYGVTRGGQTSSWNATQMAAAIYKMIGVTPTGDPSTWVQLEGVGGYITGAVVYGVRVSASKFYDNLYGLYSPYVTSFSYNAAAGTWTAVTSGNGHCLGMSQTGAMGYAKNGWNYLSILYHYYPGTILATY